MLNEECSQIGAPLGNNRLQERFLFTFLGGQALRDCGGCLLLLRISPGS